MVKTKLDLLTILITDENATRIFSLEQDSNPGLKCFFKVMLNLFMYKWYFVSKIVLFGRKSNREKLLKFEAEGQEFANFLTSLVQFILAVKGQNNFW